MQQFLGCTGYILVECPIKTTRQSTHCWRLLRRACFPSVCIRQSLCRVHTGLCLVSTTLDRHKKSRTVSLSEGKCAMLAAPPLSALSSIPAVAWRSPTEIFSTISTTTPSSAGISRATFPSLAGSRRRSDVGTPFRSEERRVGKECLL